MSPGERIRSTRRTAIKSLAGLFGISSLTTIGEADVPTTEIATIKRHGEVMQTATVAEEWYRQVKRIRERVQVLQDNLRNVPGVEWIGYSFGGEYIRDRTRPQFSIGYNPTLLKQELPDHVDGFDVARKEVGESSLLCMNQGDYNPVPGGVTVEGEGLHGKPGTSGAQVTDSDGEKHLITANHLMTKCGASSETLTLKQNGRDFGEVSQANGDEDWAIVKPYNDFSTKNTIKQGTDGELTISGSYTENGVDNLGCYDSDGECKTVISMGTTTGRTYGTVQNHHIYRTNKCPTMNNYGLRLYMESARGDSGGLTYGRETYNGTTYAVKLNIVNAGEDKDGTASCNGAQKYQYQHGMPFYHLKNYYGIR